MSRSSSRYFKNPYNDDGRINISNELYKARTQTCVEHILKNLKATEDNCDGGLYVGISGVAYVFYHLAKCGMFGEDTDKYLKIAKSYIDVALEYCNKRNRRPKDQVSFLLEDGGVYVVASLIYNVLGERQKCQQYVEEYKKLAAFCEPLSFLDNGSDELFVGRAGYLYGILMLQTDLKMEIPILPDDGIALLCRTIVESGKKFRSRLQFEGQLPLMYAYHGTLYLGTGHGIAGILQALMSFPRFMSRDSASAQLIKTSVDYLLHHCLQGGNVATDIEGALNPRQGRMLVHWCHGAAGIIYMFARAYLIFGKEEKYLNACKLLADTIWEKGLLRKGPGICHGVAGSGYTFLLMYRLTGEQKYLHRAERFAGFMFTEVFSEGARTPDNPFSLFEGLAGTICFLNDIMQPHKAEFPLFPVFVE